MKIELDLTAATRKACEEMLPSDIRESVSSLIGLQIEADAHRKAREAAAEAVGELDESAKPSAILDAVKGIIGNVAAEADNDGESVAELAKAAAWLYRDAANSIGMKGGTIDNYTSFIAKVPNMLAKGTIEPDWLSEAKQADLQYLCASDAARHRTELKELIREETKTRKGESSAARDKRVKAMLDAVRSVLSAEFAKVAEAPARKAA